VLWEDLVKEEINDHARDGNVHPNRPGPAGDDLMLIKPRTKRAAESDNDHRDNGHSQHGVGEKNREVNRAEPGRILKDRPACFGVINEITDQEQCGRDYGREHALLVRGNIFAPDENKAGGEKNCAQAIEAGVDRRQVMKGHRSLSKRLAASRISA